MDIGKLTGNRASSEIVVCSVDSPVGEAIAILAKRRIGAMPVTRAGKVVGIFSERDVVYRLAEEGTDCLAKKVGGVMTAPAITVDRQTSVDDALGLMTRRRIRHLPVMEGEHMVGFISIGDLVKSRIVEVEQEAKAMRDYIATA
ncbi:CBS domain-containing protein [Qipengyuania sp. JC766]|uniref:CBS domain-containing protein n=1 Tax=Qipengyuania sp. JC766 TaxID=3232139 RepID=UPI003457E76B